MNKFCRTLVQNVGHLRMMRQLGQSKFSPALSLIAFDRSHVSPVSASPNLIGARFYMNKRNPNYDFKPREQRSRFPTNDDDDQYADAEPVESVGHEISFEAQSGTNNGFAEFGLPELLLKRLDELGYKTPFEIQAATLKHTLEGRLGFNFVVVVNKFFKKIKFQLKEMLSAKLLPGVEKLLRLRFRLLAGC